MKYNDQIQVFNRPWPLPWPMNSNESAVYVLAVLAGGFGSTGAVLWLSTELIEPSPWRLLPVVLWVVALKVFVVPAVVRLLAPADLAHRRETMDFQRSWGTDSANDE